MRVFLLLGLVFAASFSFAQASPVCNAFHPAGGYCVYPGSDLNKDIVYYFHGRAEEDVAEPYTRWGETNYYPQQIRDYWQAKGIPAPTVISVSLGPVWLFTQASLSAFVGQIQPAIESAIGGLRGRRMVMGESMGGFNSTQLAFRTGLFEKAAILCAPMVDGVSPFSSTEDIEAYVLRSTAYAYHGQAGAGLLQQNVSDSIMLARFFFPTPQEWADADPVQIAANAVVASSPKKVYVAAGFHDAYVLYEGNVKFVSLLRDAGVDVEWRPQWGGHCAVDIPSLSEFLIK